MTDEFLKLIKDLNQEQEEIVKSKKNLYVTACPGSGKTRVLTRKIAWESIEHTDSLKKIVAITYTNKAADEIKERIESLGIDGKNIWVGTIHQFCLEFIIYPSKMNLPIVSKGFVIIDDYTQLAYLNQIIDELNFQIQYPNKIDLTLSLEFEINEKKYPEIAKKYHEKLEKNKEIDFDMILLIAYKILLVNNSVADRVANYIRAIYVDEFQDTRELQYKVIGKLTRNNPQIQTMFVGDIDQAIYGSLNGVAKTSKELKKITNQFFKEKTLTGCYRSSQRIVNFYSNFMSTPYKIESRGQNKDGTGCIYYDYEIGKEYISYAVKNIIQDRLDNGIKERDICIVSPQHFSLFSLAKDLKKEFPNREFDAPSISPIKTNNHSIFFKLAILYFTESGKKVSRRKAIASEILTIFTNEFGIEITENFLSLDLLKIINNIKRQCIKDNGVELYKFVTNRLLSELQINKNTCPSIINQYDFFVEQMEKRIADYSLSTTINDFEKIFKERKGITITTAHKVKGKEYDTVIAINLLKGKIPHWNEVINSSDDGNNSARKLLYVICSRAKNNLFLFSETGYTTQKGSPLSPNQLLWNINFDYNS